MSHVEETTEELSNPCTFCGEAETCRHGDGCELCCLDCRREEEIVEQKLQEVLATSICNALRASIDNGMKVGEIRAMVEGYLDAEESRAKSQQLGHRHRLYCSDL